MLNYPPPMCSQRQARRDEQIHYAQGVILIHIRPFFPACIRGERGIDLENMIDEYPAWLGNAHDRMRGADGGWERFAPGAKLTVDIHAPLPEGCDLSLQALQVCDAIERFDPDPSAVNRIQSLSITRSRYRPAPECEGDTITVTIAVIGDE